MPDIPDAPWIRETENDGLPDMPPIHCPFCGEEVEFFYIDVTGEVVGCDRCVTTDDPYC